MGLMGIVVSLRGIVSRLTGIGGRRRTGIDGLTGIEESLMGIDGVMEMGRSLTEVVVSLRGIGTRLIRIVVEALGIALVGTIVGNLLGIDLLEDAESIMGIVSLGV